MPLPDEKTAAADLGKQKLYVMEIAQTPLRSSPLIIDQTTDRLTNPALDKALTIYAKHYLASQDGIPGEGEDPAVIQSRLQGNDPNVKAMSVYGLAGADGQVHGAAFVETYHIHTKGPDGKPQEGLVHLLTYAASEPGYDHFDLNAAFHAGILDKLKDLDRKLGFTGRSVLTTEVNSFRDYEGEPIDSSMGPEFEIKTGVESQYREEYSLTGKASVIGLDGRYNRANILQIAYTPPALAGEESESLEHINSVSDLVPHLRNEDAFNGQGEPLFLTAETLDGAPLTSEHMDLLQGFQKQLLISVMGDRGVTDKGLILEARDHQDAGFRSMDAGFSRLKYLLASQQAQKTIRPASSLILG